MGRKVKTVNEVTLQGYMLTPEVKSTRYGELVTAGLCTEVGGRKIWHTVIPRKKQAIEAFKCFGEGRVVKLRGRYNGRRYTNNEDALRYANEIVVFDPPEETSSEEHSNTIIVIGNLGRDPHVAYPKEVGSEPIVSLAVATHSHQLVEGNWRTYTTWHALIMRGERSVDQTADLRKGHKVMAEGVLVYRPAKRGGGNPVAEVLVESLKDPYSYRPDRPAANPNQGKFDFPQPPLPMTGTGG